MEREYKDLDHGLGEMTHIAQMDRELQQLRRTYMIPPTHELVVTEVGMRFTVSSRLKPEFQQPSPALVVSPPFVPPVIVPIKPDEPLGSLVQAPPKTPSPAALAYSEEAADPAGFAAAADLAALSSKSQAELLQLAAELEVDGVNKSMSKAKIAAAIVEKRHAPKE